MKFIVIELQQSANGTLAHLETVKDTLAEAESTYFSILAAAAISKLPVHSAAVLMANGTMLRHYGYDRRVDSSQAEE